MTADEKVIGECLRAAVEGPFFPRPLFHTLIGRNREEVAALLTTWPQSDDLETLEIAVNNVLLNLLWYPHKQMAAWDKYIPVPYGGLKAVFERWREAHRQLP